MLDAGDRSCVMEATSIAGARGRLGGTRFAVLVFTNLTQDHLDLHGSMDEYFAAKAALFDQAERAVVNVGDEWGRRLAGVAAGRAHVHTRRRAGRARRQAARPLQPRQRPRRRVGGARAGCRRAGDSRRRRSGRRRARPLRVGRSGPALCGDRRLRAYAGLARERPAHGARARRTPDGRVRRRRRPRPREAAADGPCRRGASPTARSSRPTIHARRIRRRSPPRSPTGRSRSCSTAARRSRPRSPAHGPGDVVVIAGKGADTQMEIAGRRIAFDDRAVVREVLA